MSASTPTRARHALADAATSAAVVGLQRYGPAAVGLSLVAVPVCAVAAFGHFVLDVPPWVSAVGIGLGQAGVTAWGRIQLKGADR